MSKVIDLTGQQFGKLTVIKRTENNKRGDAQWLCECNCENHNTIITRGSSLKNGSTQSCGCLIKEIIKLIGKANKKENIFNISGEFGIGYTFNNEEFYFDLEDFDLIKDYCWSKDNNGYIIAPQMNDRKTFIRMHRLVMNPPQEMDIDHIYHIKHDNRKSELRITNRSQNCMNHKLSNKNTSGYTGIWYNKNTNKWCAEIMINNKKISLGSFINIEDAIKARQEGEIKYHGEYRYNK